MPLAVWSQHYNIKNYSIEEGLPQSQVHALCQCSNGYIWIGTLGGGVSKFDGVRFKNFSTHDGLVNNYVLTIFEDSNHNTWFGTEKGVCRFDGELFHSLDNGNELNSTSVRAILEDREGNLWFGAENGAWKYNGKFLEHFTTQQGLANGGILSMLKDSKGQFWFGTDNGVSKFDGTTFINFTTRDGLVNNSVYTILEDRRQNLWFGTEDGISKYDGKSFQNYTEANGLIDGFIRAAIEDHEGNCWFATNEGGICIFDGKVFRHITESNGLSSNTVWALLQDRENNVWIGTYRGGLDRYSGETFTNYSSKDGLGDDVIRWIHEDKTGKLWFATYRKGINRLDGNSVTTITEKDGLIDNFVLTICEDKKGNLWFGTYNGACKYDGKRFVPITSKEGLAGKIVRAIIEDRAGNIWFGTNSSGISRYDGTGFTIFTSAEGLTCNSINTLMEDRDGGIWAGTEDGLYHYNGKRFAEISTACGWKQKHIYAIVQDTRGILWLAAYGDGLLRYNPEEKCSVRVINHKNGLNNNNVVSLAFDDNGKLWIGTEKGICRLDVDIYEKTGETLFKYYGKAEGFVGIECIHNSICKDNQGNMWFGTLKGAMKYNPGQDKSNPVEPLTHIVDVRFLFGENTLWEYSEGKPDENGLPNNLKLPYNKNNLVFDFIGISFTIPEKVRYRYMLDGLDNAWVEVREGSYANYSNIPPGKYSFKVMAANNDGVWNTEPAVFTFRIQPPFWNTWWFYILAVVVLGGSIYSLIKTRLKLLERQRRIMQEKVESSTRELKQEKEKVEQINLELESRVEERTYELLTINESLQAEIDERRIVDAALRESEEKFRLVVEYANDAIFIIQDEVITFPNPKTIQMLGYTEEELKEINFFQLVHPSEAEKVKDRESKRLEGEVFSTPYSFRVISKSQKELWVDLNSVFIFWEGKPATLNFFRDITEKKRLEAQLLEAQKMKAIGTMAGGIAHDFNNLLMGILGNVSLVLSDIDQKHPNYNELTNIEQLVQSGAHLTRQLLGFAKGGKYEVKPTDLNQLVGKSAEMFNRTKKEIIIHKKFDENLHTVEVDRGQIEQVLVNLYVNAWQAMPNGGEIYLQTSNIHIDKNDSETFRVIPGNYVKISITDTGVGMDEATKERIFEPFFTTKEMGRGTGLGLASVYGIITNHGGSIHVYSEKGKGTTFNIYLPASEKKVEEEPVIVESYKEGTETILLVDDEEMITDVGERLLKKLGYTVIIARSGKEALDVYEKNRDKIRLVILDIIMPGMGGGETFAHLKKIDPEILVLLSSGYSMNGHTDEIMKKGCKGFIQKPFRLKQLSQIVRSVLDNSEAPAERGEK